MHDLKSIFKHHLRQSLDFHTNIFKPPPNPPDHSSHRTLSTPPNPASPAYAPPKSPSNSLHPLECHTSRRGIETPILGAKPAGLSKTARPSHKQQTQPQENEGDADSLFYAPPPRTQNIKKASPNPRPSAAAHELDVSFLLLRLPQRGESLSRGIADPEVAKARNGRGGGGGRMDPDRRLAPRFGNKRGREKDGSSGKTKPDDTGAQMKIGKGYPRAAPDSRHTVVPKSILKPPPAIVPHPRPVRMSFNYNPKSSQFQEPEPEPEMETSLNKKKVQFNKEKMISAVDGTIFVEAVVHNEGKTERPWREKRKMERPRVLKQAEAAG